jgi:hypothetical protein
VSKTSPPWPAPGPYPPICRLSRPGERITATLQNINKDQTFQGRVNGRDVVLSLPQSVKAGDTLELIVSEVTPRAVFASLANPAPLPSDKPALSQTGKLISFLLTGQPSPGSPPQRR